MEDNGLWPFGDKNSFHRCDPQAPPVVKSGDYSAETWEWEQEEGVFVAPLSASVHSVMISCRALHIALQMSVQRLQRERERGREGTDKGFRELPIAMDDACHFYGDANAASGHDFAKRERVPFLYQSKSLSIPSRS